MTDSSQSSTLFGVSVAHADRQELIRRITSSVEERHGESFLYLNAHVLSLSRREPDLASLLERANLVFCDGYGVRLVARIVGQVAPPRSTPPDWIDDLLANLPRGTRLAMIGDEPDVVRLALRRALDRHGHLFSAGSLDGFQDLSPSQLAGRILAMEADIALVGMGTPIQEQVVIATRREGGPTLLAVGGLFRYYSGVERRGPRTMTDLGLEWLTRWVTHPARHFRRYGIELPWLLMSAVVWKLKTRSG